MRILKNYFNDWTLFEKIWLTIFTIIMIVLSIVWKDSIIGFISSLTGIWCVVLVAKGKISNYWFGFINVLLYGYIAFSWGLMGEVTLNWGYFLPMNFIGWYLWLKNKDHQKKDLVLTNVFNIKEKMIWFSISFILVIAYGFLLKYLHTFNFIEPLNIVENPTPFFDATSTVLSVIAMILMVKRYAEQWTLWIVVDIVSVIMWMIVIFKSSNQEEIGNAILTVTMWLAYLINAIYGRLNWSKLYQLQHAKIGE